MPAPKNTKKKAAAPAKKAAAKKTIKKATTAPSKKKSAAPAPKAPVKKTASSKKTTAALANKAVNKTAPKKAGVKPAKAASKKVGLLGNFPTIPVSDAVQRTQQWCDYNMSLYSSMNLAPDFARAFFVGKDDIQALHEMFQADSNLMGCRMYMGMQHELNSGNGYVWSICLVAVEHSDTSVNGIDVVVSPDTGASTVFDFSHPCPNSCDLQSVLYHPAPPVTKPGKKLK